jgi:acyl-CoA synthetase (AMP-forming)/AMP-acid ligase II
MLTELLIRSAVDRPSSAAIVQDDRRISYEELEWESARRAAQLGRLGVASGDTVAIVLPNCPEFVYAFFAVMRLSAIALPLNPGYTTTEISRFLHETPARAVITDASRAAACRESVSSATHVIVCWDEAEVGEPASAPSERFAGNALYLFTSGSTGSTKRVLFTQRNLFFEALNFVESTGIGPGDTILCPVPLYHSYGLCLGMLDAVYTGATLVLEPQPDEPFPSRCARLMELLREETVRVFPGVPWQFAVLADTPGDVRAAFRDVTWCMSSGDLLPRRTFDHFLSRTGRRIRSFYGSTEAGSVTMETGPERDVEIDAVGAPLKNVSIAILDTTGAPMPPGRTGEIWIQSPSLPPTGYDDDVERTRDVFRDGWYDSGDLGHVDSDGRLFLAGRKQSIINVGSYKVDATEIEETLLEISGVREAAVVGVHVPNAGTMVKAVLALSSGDRSLAEGEVRAHCRQRLSLFKVPRIIEFVPALPRDAMGKIQRRELASADRYLNSIRDAATLRTLDQIHRMTPARQRALVTQVVQQHVAAVLGQTPQSLPRDAGFADLGMDSFGSIELLTRLDLLFALGLPQTFTFDYPSIAAATDELLNRLRNVSD